MASRSNVSDGITIAQLDGRARYLLEHKVPRDVALDDLRSIGATPDLIRTAADTALARWQRDPTIGHHGDQVADLLQGLLPRT